MKPIRFTVAEVEKMFANAERAEWQERVETDPKTAWREFALKCAEDAKTNRFPSRRGIYVINDVPTSSGQAICLYNNNPYRKPGHGNVIDHARRDTETELFRRRMMELGIGELGYATFPPAGHDLAGYTYALILDGTETQSEKVRDAMREALREAWEQREAFPIGGTDEQDGEIAESDRNRENGLNDEIAEEATVSVGVASQLRKVRVGQDMFSRRVRENYGHRCCFPGCDVDHDELLVAAHIARWADNSEARGDIANGLCLCGLHDKAFESGFFTLTDDFRVKVEAAKAASSEWANSHLRGFDGQQIKLGKIRPSMTAICEHRSRHS